VATGLNQVSAVAPEVLWPTGQDDKNVDDKKGQNDTDFAKDSDFAKAFDYAEDSDYVDASDFANASPDKSPDPGFAQSSYAGQASQDDKIDEKRIS